MTVSAAPRLCMQCDRPLPESARPERRYCSTRCRQRHWDAINRPEEAPAVHPRLHWHVDRVSILTGYATEGYWRGEGCPPECPGIEPPGGWVGVPVGREGFLPPARRLPRRCDGPGRRDRVRRPVPAVAALRVQAAGRLVASDDPASGVQTETARRRPPSSFFARWTFPTFRASKDRSSTSVSSVC